MIQEYRPEAETVLQNQVITSLKLRPPITDFPVCQRRREAAAHPGCGPAAHLQSYYERLEKTCQIFFLNRSPSGFSTSKACPDEL